MRTYRPIQTFCCGPRKALTRRGRGPGRSNLNTRERWGLHRDDTEVSGVSPVRVGPLGRRSKRGSLLAAAGPWSSHIA